MKTAVNRALASVIGYELTRADKEPAAAPKQAAPRAEKSAADKVGGKGPGALADKKPKKSTEPEEPRFPADYDDEYKAIISAVRPYTMTGNDKLHALITATRYIHDHAIPGAVVECGVWRGGSMHAVARTLDSLDDHSRDLFLFDTFEGMTEPTDEDVRYDGAGAAQLLASRPRDARIWAYASLEDVKNGFTQVPYPAERIHYVQGPVEKTVPEQAPEQIALLRLDTDWYVSTKHEFEHLYPRLVSGGVLFVDDFGWFQGSRKATEEFLERTGERLLLIRTASGRVAVKP